MKTLKIAIALLIAAVTVMGCLCGCAAGGGDTSADVTSDESSESVESSESSESTPVAHDIDYEAKITGASKSFKPEAHGKVFVIHSVEELDAYCAEYDSEQRPVDNTFVNDSFREDIVKYNEAYFENRVLIIGHWYEGSISIKVSVKNVRVNEQGKTEIEIQRICPDSRDDAIAWYRILVEREAGAEIADENDVVLIHTDIRGMHSVGCKAHYIRTDGDYSGKEFPSVKIIRSVSELKAYYASCKDGMYEERYESLDEYLGDGSRYNDEYFKDRILVILLLEEGSGSISHSVSGLSVDENGKAYINVRRYCPELRTADMAYWHILVEPAADTEIANEESVTVNFYDY